MQPKHIAIVMDGNGRWAERRRRPRSFGHKAGVDATRTVVESCLKRGIPALTLFAFSSENWGRPRTEVRSLMDLFLRSLNREVDELHGNGVRLQFVGQIADFSEPLRSGMRKVQDITSDNDTMRLSIAVNYGGRWDISQAAKALATKAANGELNPQEIDEKLMAQHCCLSDLPEPDLLIRTGGEMRISNFLLWQLAYTEFYFSDVLWPDFKDADLELAIEAFGARKRRFGCTDTPDERSSHIA
jgi:undecaprenyl diphosphate synthase